jgi:hypothetical protein
MYFGKKPGKKINGPGGVVNSIAKKRIPLEINKPLAVAINYYIWKYMHILIQQEKNGLIISGSS